MLVVNDGNGVLQFFDLTWDGNTPAISHKYSYIADARATDKSINQMAFDYAGNLICAGKNIGMYSIPTDVNVQTTPGMDVINIPGGQTGYDINCDGNTTIADVTCLIDYLLGGNPQPIDLNAANVNGDDGITIADVTALIDYLLSGN